MLDEQWIKKIEFIDEIRSKFSVCENEQLKLPQIIVVGDQSSGKSSILEAISGIKLPKGVNTVTKCPVIIQMRNTKHSKTQIKYKSSPFKEINDTETEIVKIQKEAFKDELTKEPITVSIESPDVMTLTIIDLPGLVKADVHGQSKDMIKKTHEIATHFMKQENSLIICVLPANQDISTTTTILEATKCNSDRSRIIGVLTKLDKLDEKEVTLIPDILKNIKLPIAKGFYGLSVSDSLLNMKDKNDRSSLEKNIFLEKKLYDSKYEKRLGLENFQNALVKELFQLIDKGLPALKKNINDLLQNTNYKLASFSKYYGNEELQSNYMIETVNTIKKKNKNLLVKGIEKIHNFGCIKTYLESENILKSISENETFLYMWLSIFKDLYKKFDQILKDNFTLNSGKYKDLKKLEEKINKCRTESISIFPSSEPFKEIVNEILETFKNETLKCVDKCVDLIKFIIENVLVEDIEQKLQQMKNDIKEISLQILNDQYKNAIMYLEYLFESEHSYFSQDDIVEAYDKETSKDLSENTTPKLPVSQSDFNVSQLTRNIPNIPNMNKFTPNPEIKPISNESIQYKNGKALKDNLEKYLNNTMRRFGDVIPNFIRLSLFVNFNKILVKRLLQEFISQRKFGRYFSITDEEKMQFDQLQASKKNLQEYSSQLENWNRNTQNKLINH